MTDQPVSARTLSARTKAVFNRRRVGRAVTVAAVIAAVTCVVGAVVAWRLLGDLETRSSASLDVIERTLTNVDESLAIAQDVTTTVGNSLDTLTDSLATLSTGIGDGAAALDSVADLTEDIPPALDRLDTTLIDLGDAAAVVDSALEALDGLPIGPDFDANAGLAASVDGVRDDLRPIAKDLRGSTTSIRDLSGSSDDLVAQLAALDDDLADLDDSLERSTRLLDSYRADAAEAVALAQGGRDNLDRDIALSRALAVLLAAAIAVGQIAPFHIGRQLAATPDPQPGQRDSLAEP
jgi:septal ring factor EnvC (AmiA/AmiB activator)